MNTQPEALRLADRLHEYWDSYDEEYQAATELRRLHEVNQELVEALEVLSGEANRFNVSGVYFNEEWMGHRGLDLAQAALAKAKGEV